MPRRPARPVSCVYSPGVSISCRSPWNFHRSSITTERAGHVDAERQRLGREHDLDESGLEQLFYRFLEHGQHAGVVGRDAGGERVLEVVEPQRLQVLVLYPRSAHLGELADSPGLL